MSQSREGQVFSAEMAGHETWLKEKKNAAFLHSGRLLLHPVTLHPFCFSEV